MTQHNIFLRPLRKTDIDSFMKSLADEEILYMTGTTTTYTREQIEAYLEQIERDETRRNYAICLDDDEHIVGDLSILDIDEQHHKAAFRISLHNREHLGKGIGTIALKLTLKIAFEELKLNRLQLEVFSHNRRGIRSYKKAGFKVDGVLRQAFLTKDGYSDEIIMSILREEYDREHAAEPVQSL